MQSADVNDICKSNINNAGHIIFKPKVDDPHIDRIWRNYRDDSALWFCDVEAFKWLVSNDIITFDDDYCELSALVQSHDGDMHQVRVGGEYTYLPQVVARGFVYGTYPIARTIDGKEDLERLCRACFIDRKWGVTKWMAHKIGVKPYYNVQNAIKSDDAWEDWMDNLNEPMDWN